MAQIVSGLSLITRVLITIHVNNADAGFFAFEQTQSTLKVGELSNVAWKSVTLLNIEISLVTLGEVAKNSASDFH